MFVHVASSLKFSTRAFGGRFGTRTRAPKPDVRLHLAEIVV